MINLNQWCTVTTKTLTSVDAATDTPTYSETAVMVDQPCAFAVLSAQQHTESWGDGTTATATDTVTASLLLPSWAPPMTGADAYTVTVRPWPGTWHVTAKRPGSEWNIYLLAANL